MRANGIAAIAAFLAVSAGADAAEVASGTSPVSASRATIETITLTDQERVKLRPAASSQNG